MEQVIIPFTEAKSRLSKYGRMAEAGQSTLVLRHRHAAFMIVPPPAELSPCEKRPGLLRGRIRVSADFDETSADVIVDFEGGA